MVESLWAILAARFEWRAQRRGGVAWADVLARIGVAPGALASLGRMEEAGGAPDVVVLDRPCGRLAARRSATAPADCRVVMLLSSPGVKIGQY